MNQETKLFQKDGSGKKTGKKTWKFWFVFWLISAALLFGWFIFLQVKNRNIENLKPLVKIMPFGSERRNELQVLTDIYQKAGGFDREQTFLILFQNDMELRPGGGFIGSFGILKTNNGKVSDIQIHDTGIFDGRIPDSETPPYPMGEDLHIKSWKMRDSNWSPDFKTNAQKAEYFYKLGQGGENFDGVFAINTNVLNSFLAITGPLKINDYPGEYNSETAILQLEYQVEKGYQEQGIEKGERKSVMREMAEVLVEKAHNFTIREQLELAKKMEDHLKSKDIQLYFKNESLDAEVESMNWGGKTREYSGDYLMVVDANLNALKSDICIKRKIDYNVDMASENPKVRLALTYEHTCRAKDWMTTNYNSWTRVYAPPVSWLENSSVPREEIRFSEELGKKVVGLPVYVPIGETKTVTLEYNLPVEFKKKIYSLMVQKQSGSGEVDFSAKVQKTDGTIAETAEKLTGDKVFSF